MKRNPLLLSFVGADGSGKSTLARVAAEECNRMGRPAQVVWSRYNNIFTKPLLAVARCTGHSRREVHEGATFGYHDFQQADGLRYAFIALQTLDVNLAAWWKARTRGGAAAVIVFERSPWDTLADVMLDTGCEALATNTWGRWMTVSMRGRGPVFWVRRSRQAILATRPELRHDRLLDAKLALYERLAAQFGWHQLDNDRPLEEAKAAVRQWCGHLPS